MPCDVCIDSKTEKWIELKLVMYIIMTPLVEMEFWDHVKLLQGYEIS